MAFVEHNCQGIVYLTSDLVQAAHAFTTRYGGVSEGIFSSLNLAVDRGDRYENVLENYRRILTILSLNEENTVLSRQVHKACVKCVTDMDKGCGLFRERNYEADGLITDQAGIALVVFAADCVPILLEDTFTGAVAAVHSGWRGTVQNIVGNAVRKMKEKFDTKAENINAAIGPCISSCCYEVGKDVHDGISSLGDNFFKYLKPCGDEKWMADLKGVNRELLINAGLSDCNIDVCPQCTFCSSNKFWSHRATNGRRGSQAAIISVRVND